MGGSVPSIEMLELQGVGFVDSFGRPSLSDSFWGFVGVFFSPWNFLSVSLILDRIRKVQLETCE